jgi:hypothetical protein
MTTTSAPLPLPRPSSGLPMLVLIVTLLTLPFAIAAGLYLLGWQPARTGNHGTLLNPPQPLPADGLLDSAGRPLATAELHGKWLLILAGRGACDAACRGRVDEMRRIQVSLNKDMGRLHRVVLTDNAGDSGLSDFRQQQPDLVVAAAPALWLPCKEQPAEQNAYRLYVADPQGQLIISYRPDVAGKAVRADLDRLLKFAWTG